VEVGRGEDEGDGALGEVQARSEGREGADLGERGERGEKERRQGRE